jgi:uncharacterized membrane protein
MPWLFFAIAAPALFAVTNFIDKFIIEKHVEDIVALAIVSGGISFIFGFIILAIMHFPFLGWEVVLLILLSGALGELALLPYFKAMKLDDASRVLPLFQIIPFLILLLAYLFLGETLTGGQLFGFCFILLGGFLLSLKKLDLKVFSLRPSFWYMILSSSLYAAGAVIFKFVVTPGNFWNIIAYEILGGGLVILALALYNPYRVRAIKVARRATGSLWGAFVANESVYLAARLSVSYAFALAAVALVSVLNGFQPLFALLYGVILSLWFPRILKEDIKGSTIALKVVSIALIFVGLWFVTF